MQDGLLDRKHAILMREYIENCEQNNFEIVSCETPYNHYGERGFIDLILRKSNNHSKICYWKLCEFKPMLFDLGETIRQIHRSKEYFFKDQKKLLNQGFSNIIEFPLSLEANKTNLSVCLKYLELLRDINIEFFSTDTKLAQQITTEFEIQKEIIKIQRSN